jgi:hypothetical protein
MSTIGQGGTIGNPAAQSPEVTTTVKVLRSVQPALSPFLQKILDFVIGLLTGVGGELSVKGDYSKNQTADVLGTTYTFTETVNGSADIKATPS